MKILFFYFINLSLGLMTIHGSSFSQIKSAKIQGPHYIEIQYSGTAPNVEINDVKIIPNNKISKIESENKILKIFTEVELSLQQHYYVSILENPDQFLIPDGILDSLYSEKLLGYETLPSGVNFRLFAPRAKWVKLVLFEHFSDIQGKPYLMQRDEQGVWEYQLDASCTGKYYGYRIWGPQGNGELFDSTLIIADPYSPASVTQNHYTHPAKTPILALDPYKWAGDNWLNIPWSDLIIYEMHVRDLTAHSTSGLSAENRGYYTSLLDTNQYGGLNYIKNLGVNAVELLPCQDFGNLEVPYMDNTAPVFNTWNPYARNHWGYMTSYFFAPESYYAAGADLDPASYCGAGGSQITEFKEMVDAFHREGIAVLMDVVYNHVSQYDYNPLKYIDKFYYFRLNEDCSFTSVSGCGNDLKTERPMVRRLIKDSVIHWMKEYHIDGFRFDLAKMIDWQTIDEIREVAKHLNPNVILIAEPWGGGYDPGGFSDHGWASWNDQIRNGVKGQNPKDGMGFIFGKWEGNNNPGSMQRYIKGSLRQNGGQYRSTFHSVNYLESHDDHTLGDFIRLGLGDIKENDRITDIDRHAKLTSKQMRLNKLAALFLFVAQGPIMIHEGQEFARSKVIAPTLVADDHVGMIDHNSYNKDNETNWLNFDHARFNRELVDYYRGLISLRKGHPAFARVRQDQYNFMQQPDSLYIGFTITDLNQKYLVLLNGHPENVFNFELPSGNWGILADQDQASDVPLRWIKTKLISIPPTSGIILIDQ